MPIYEFYCPDCNTIYSFFSNKITKKRPNCPIDDCERKKLEKRPSRFAMLKHGDAEEDDPFADLDDARLESAMETLATEFEGLEESEDPRLLGRAFRRFGEVTGLDLGPRMEEALQRMELGEDPESVEADLGLDDEEGDDFEDFFKLKKNIASRLARPKIDETLHFM